MASTTGAPQRGQNVSSSWTSHAQLAQLAIGYGAAGRAPPGPGFGVALVGSLVGVLATFAASAVFVTAGSAGGRTTATISRRGSSRRRATRVTASGVTAAS